MMENVEACGGAPGGGPGWSILMVEDDLRFRETLADAMALRDVRVEGASSGAEALESLDRRPPSLILLDVQLPDTHGFELCRRIRGMYALRGVHIIFLSARYTEPADRAEGLLAGADAYLAKPVNLDALWEEVHYLLDKRA